MTLLFIFREELLKYYSTFIRPMLLMFCSEISLDHILSEEIRFYTYVNIGIS